MAYVYQADLWCDACAADIARALRSTGTVPEDPSDHDSFDSDDYPKGPFPDDDPSDAPHHCAGGRDCTRRIVLRDGKTVSALVSGLTEEGRKYVLERIQSLPQSALVAFWEEHYNLNNEGGLETP